MVEHGWYAGIRALFEPVTNLVDPTQRLWWPFLVTSAALAFLVALSRGASAMRAARSVLEPRVWLHRSAKADYQLVALKAVLRALTVGVAGLSALAIAGLTVAALRSLGGAPMLRAPLWLATALFTVVVFVAEDFSRFALHWAMHKAPALWAFHRVHHSAEVLTPVTLYRTHPVESALNRASSAAVIGAVTGVFVWAFGGAVRGWQLFTVDALGLAWTLFGANLRHSHLWLSYGPRVERWLLSPAQHQVHHSIAARHQNKNFGTVFSLWDRLFGSLYTTTRTPERLRFGLRRDRQPQSGLGLLVEPFRWLAARSPRGGRLLAPARVAVASMALIVTGCMPLTAPYDRAELLQSMAACTTDVHTQFQASVDALVTAARAHEASPSEATLTAAKAAFSQAFDLWQQAEILRFGPAADRASAGGQALREQIYGWPEHNRCLIEEQLVGRGYEAAAFASAPVTLRTLAAIEYLLFSAETTNVCPPDHAINVMGAWAAISAQEMTQRRAAYARVVSEQVAQSARALSAAWTGDAGFARVLTTAGRGSSLFETQQSALGAVAEAPFYLDTDTKDLRLGTPLGLLRCEEESCPGALESPYANRARVNVRNNLRGARRILLGCSAGGDRGFDDMLEAVGAPALAAQLRAHVTAAETAVDAIEGDGLRGPLETDRARVLAAHNAIRDLTSFLKMEFSATLQLSSRRVAGDTD